MMKRAIIFLIIIEILFMLGIPLMAQQKYDFLIQNATVYDGLNLRGVSKDVAILGDTIAKVGKINPAGAQKVIDAKGLVLAPGFIDAHTHADFNPLVYPDLHNKIFQGVTTEVVGNCGMSAAPVGADQKETLRGVWAREGVQIPKEIPWTNFQQYRQALDSKMETNIVGLAGHGNLRTAVMGFSPRPASKKEIAKMKKLLDQAMSQGAGGISYGLIYLPGIFAQEDELVELCREAGTYGGICTFHMRSEGSKLPQAVEEAIRIGQKAGTPIQISHLKAGGGAKNWDKIDDAFRLIEAARKNGQSVEADVYPYTSGAAELGVVLPDEIYQLSDRVAIFRDPKKRADLLYQLQYYYQQKGMKWDSVMIAAVADPKYQKFEGKTLREISEETGREPEDFLIDILGDTGFEVSAFYFTQIKKVMERVMEKKYVTIGSDSIADGSSKPHPRAFGTFPKIFKEFVSKKKLSMGEAIRKMTSATADHFHLDRRGRIFPGYFADLVLFDPDQFKDRSTYESPKLLSRGVQWVFVNGRPVIEEGRPTGEKPGRVLSPVSNSD